MNKPASTTAVKNGWYYAAIAVMSIAAIGALATTILTPIYIITHW